MNVEILKSLTRAVKASIAGLGGDWVELIYGDPVLGREWKALSLVMTGSTYEFKNRHLTKVSIALSLDKFVEAYEKAIKLTLKYDEYTQLRKTKQLFGLTDKQVTLLFPVPDKEITYVNFPALAVLAYDNYDGEIVISDYNSFVVKVGDFRFGVDDGKVITNSGKVYKPQAKPQYAKPHLLYGRRRSLANTNLAKRFSTILGGLNCASLDEGVVNELITAMTILLYYETPEIAGLWGISKDNNKAFPHAMIQTLKIAEDFDQYIDPIGFLRDQLIPFALSQKQFRECFGSEKVSSPEDFTRVRYALAELTAKLKRERD